MRRGADTTRERDIIERQIRHMARLVDDLLDVSRLRRGAIELRRDAEAERIHGRPHLAQGDTGLHPRDDAQGVPRKMPEELR